MNNTHLSLKFSQIDDLAYSEGVHLNVFFWNNISNARLTNKQVFRASRVSNSANIYFSLILLDYIIKWAWLDKQAMAFNASSLVKFQE